MNRLAERGGDGSHQYRNSEKSASAAREIVRQPIYHGGHVQIPVGKDGWAVVSIEDAPLVLQYQWTCRITPRTAYAVASKTTDGLTQIILMHRLLMGDPEGKYVDHINGDGLNNIRSNIRICTSAQNGWNRVYRKPDGSAKIKGVRKRLRKGLRPFFYAELIKNGKTYRSGFVMTADEAAHEYDKLAARYHGRFASLNFPLPDSLFLPGTGTQISAPSKKPSTIEHW